MKNTCCGLLGTESEKRVLFIPVPKAESITFALHNSMNVQLLFVLGAKSIVTTSD